MRRYLLAKHLLGVLRTHLQARNKVLGLSHVDIILTKTRYVSYGNDKFAALSEETTADDVKLCELERKQLQRQFELDLGVTIEEDVWKLKNVGQIAAAYWERIDKNL